MSLRVGGGVPSGVSPPLIMGASSLSGAEPVLPDSSPSVFSLNLDCPPQKTTEKYLVHSQEGQFLK